MLGAGTYGNGRKIECSYACACSRLVVLCSKVPSEQQNKDLIKIAGHE